MKRYKRTLLIICMLVSTLGIIHITSLLHDEGSSLESLRNLLFPSSSTLAEPDPGQTDPHKSSSEVTRRANATIFMLTRNSEVEGALLSISQLEERFNSRYGYPYVFLNDEPFSAYFKERISKTVSSTAEFGLIPSEHWNQPSWINETIAREAREKMKNDGVKYGGSLSYRNMCRFNSGFFYKHELMQKYRWYWRVEPGVEFHCNIKYDPFLFMEDNQKAYSFTIATYEIMESIPGLWSSVKGFMNLHPEHIAPNNSMNFISFTSGWRYNGCHFWSNFELADMNFWRSKAYTDYFDHLDSKGGFYYERWGDAPVHSIAVSLMLPRDRIHFFEDIGYRHGPWGHCPLSESIYEGGECTCDQSNSFDYDQSSCLETWEYNMRQ